VRKEVFKEICQLHGAELVQQVGKIGVLYRYSDKERK
jgi:RNA-binding protein YhbY